MPPPQQSTNTDQTANFFWVLIILVGISLIAWYFAKDEIIAGIFFLRHYEILMIEYCLRFINIIFEFVGISPINITEWDNWLYFIDSKDYDNILWQDVVNVSSDVGVYFKYFTAPIMIILAGFLFTRSGSVRFRSTYNMDTLRKQEKENWPKIVPVLQTNFTKISLDEGPWAMAQLPFDFLKQHQLLAVTINEKGNKQYILKKERAEEVLMLQMGPLWKGVDYLPLYQKALLVIFLARTKGQNRKIADDLLDQIAASSSETNLNFKGVEGYLKNHQSLDIVEKLAKKHAYVATFLATLLEVARETGVLASAEFIWLKPLDRRLWYMLNTVGRQTPFVEVSALFSHWLAEKAIGEALRIPMIEAAVEGLAVETQETFYREEN